MEYKVGSLADLISGSSKKKSKSHDSGVKIIFQAEESASSKLKSKQKTAVDSQFQNGNSKRKRKRKVEESNDIEHRKKKKRKEIAIMDFNGIEEEYLNELPDDSQTGYTNLESHQVQENEFSASGHITNAQKRIQRKEKLKKKYPLDEEKESRTIFVKNLPNTIKESKIKRLFEKYGAIESLRFRCVAPSDPRISKKVAVIKAKFHPDRTNISAFIRFKSIDSATQALAANGMIVADHHLLVDKAIGDKTRDQRKAIFVGNVPFGAEEDDLWKIFEGCGQIFDIRIIRDKNTGIGKGFAYVNFESPDAVELALKLNGEKLKERELRISRASKKPKASLKPSFKPKQRSYSKPQKKQYSSQNKDFVSSDGEPYKSFKDQDVNKVFKTKSKYSKFQENEAVPYKSFKEQDDNKVIKTKPKHIRFQENEGANDKSLQQSAFQGQTMVDKKKKKHKKKLSREELKKKIVMKKLGIQSAIPSNKTKKHKKSR